jgi:hypothetical protein
MVGRSGLKDMLAKRGITAAVEERLCVYDEK